MLSSSGTANSAWISIREYGSSPGYLLYLNSCRCPSLCRLVCPIYHQLLLRFSWLSTDRDIAMSVSRRQRNVGELRATCIGKYGFNDGSFASCRARETRVSSSSADTCSRCVNGYIAKDSSKLWTLAWFIAPISRSLGSMSLSVICGIFHCQPTYR